MMNQQIDLLKSILFAEWTTLVTFGICLLVLQKQKKPAYQLYTRARQLLASNFLIFAMEPVLVLAEGGRNLQHSLSRDH